MADVPEVVQRSLNINEKLGPRLIAAAEQNAILRIGWTNAGDPVPKNGELGLCPGLPEGARLRAVQGTGPVHRSLGQGRLHWSSRCEEWRFVLQPPRDEVQVSR